MSGDDDARPTPQLVPAKVEASKTGPPDVHEVGLRGPTVRLAEEHLAADQRLQSAHPFKRQRIERGDRRRAEETVPYKGRHHLDLDSTLSNYASFHGLLLDLDIHGNAASAKRKRLVEGGHPLACESPLKPRTGVERPEVIQVEVRHGPVPVRRPIQERVVDHHGHTVPREQDVEFDSVCRTADGQSKRLQRVLGSAARESAMSDHLGGVFALGHDRFSAVSVYLVHMPGHDIPSQIWTRNKPFQLECGGTLPSLRIAFETWGKLDSRGENAVVVLHALSGSSHAFSSDWSSQGGWWEGLIGDGSPLDPRKHFIICANLLGGCYGTTGPSSMDPGTGAPYAATFPQMTTGDMIEAQRLLLQSLGVQRGLTLIGGSLGGMLALQWAIRHPAEVRNSIALVAPGRSGPQAIALRSVQREAILSDPDWNSGDCYTGRFPVRGLALARKIGLITYRSADEFEERFKRDQRDPRPHFLEGLFEVQSYLNHQGRKFCERFDPNSYLYFSRAMDLYDLSKDQASLQDAFAPLEARVLLLAVDSDFLVRPAEVLEAHEALLNAGKRSRFELLRSVHGHDAFLIELPQIRGHLSRFLPDE